MPSWAHPSSNPKRHVILDWFSCFCTAHGRVIILYNGPSLSPLKIAPSHQGSEPPFNAWFLGTTRAKKPNGVSIGSAILAWLTSVKDRPTDRPCYSVCNNRPHLRPQYGDADLKQNYPMTSPFTVLFVVPRFSSITISNASEFTNTSPQNELIISTKGRNFF